MAIHLFGFGGVRLTGAGIDCVLPYATGSMSFEPVNIVNTTINNVQRYTFMGYRVRIGIEAVNTTEGNDFDEFLKLVAIFNAMNSDIPITVYPYYDATKDNLSYICRSNSTFNPEQIDRVQVGQRINLEFESVELINWLPSLTSSQIWRHLTTQDIKYVTDQSGNKIIVSTST